MLILPAGGQNLTESQTAVWQSQTPTTAQTDQLPLMQEPGNTSLFEAPGPERPGGELA